MHVYDRYDRIGGLLIYGIPGFKLEKEIVERRGKLLHDGGVIFHLGVDVGHGDYGFEKLRAAHDAVLIATGVYKARDVQPAGCRAGRYCASTGLSDSVKPEKPR